MCTVVLYIIGDKLLISFTHSAAQAANDIRLNRIISTKENNVRIDMVYHYTVNFGKKPVKAHKVCYVNKLENRTIPRTTSIVVEALYCEASVSDPEKNKDRGGCSKLTTSLVNVSLNFQT